MKPEDYKKISHYLNIADVILLALDSNGNIEYINPKGCQILGCQSENVIGKNWFQNFLPDDIKGEVESSYKLIIAGGKEPNEYTVNEIKATNGTVHIIEWHNVYWKNESGNFTSVVCSGTDLTKRLSIEKELHQSEKLFQDVINNMEIGLIIYDPTEDGKDFVFKEINQCAEKIIENSSEFLLGKKFCDLFPDDSQKELINSLRKTWLSGKSTQLPIKYLDGDKIIRWVDNKIFKLPSGQIVALFEDISEQKRAEFALMESEKKFRTITENSADAIFIVNQNGKYEYVNPAACEMLDYSYDELTSMTVADLGAEYNKKTQLTRFNKIITEGKRYFETKLRRKDGSIIPVDLNSVFLPNGLIYGSCRDISERKKRNEALRESERRIRHLLENTAFIAVSLDINGNVTFANQALAEATEYQLEELTGLNWFDHFIPPETKAPVKDFVFKKTLEDLDFSPIYENEILTKSGKRRLIKWNNTIVKDLEGDIVGTTSIGEDITEQRKNEQKLNFQSQLLNSSRDAIIAMDLDGYITYWGKGAEQLFGYETNEILGKPIFGLMKPEQINMEQDRIDEAIENGIYTGVYQLNRKNGEEFWTETSISLVAQGNETPYGLIRIDRDISDKIKHEQALQESLRESQQRRKEIDALLQSTRAVLESKTFEKAADIIFNAAKGIIGADGGYVALLNEEGNENEVLYLEEGHQNCSVDPQLPMPIRGLRGEVYKDNQTKIDNQYSSSPHTEFLPSGHIQLDNVIFAPLIIAGKSVGLLGLANKEGGFTDNDVVLANAFAEIAAIALRNNHMIESLELSEARFRLLVSTATDAILLTDQHTNIVFWNEAAEKLFGYELGDVIGKEIRFLFAKSSLKHMENILEIGAQKKEKPIRISEIELELLSRNGKTFPAEMSLSSWTRKDETFITMIFKDISERKEYEIERERLIDDLKSKYEELDRFTYTVSHDLKSPLITVEGFLGFLKSDARSGNVEQIEDDINEISSAIRQMKQFMDELLELSRIGRVVHKPEKIVFNTILEKAILSVSGLINEKEITITQDNFFPDIFGEPSRIQEVLENLLGNAAKYMGDQPNPTIHIGVNTEADIPVFFIRDNGIGIEKKYYKKIFDLFEKLGKNSEGTGIGLAIVKRIIEHHHGEIWVESEGAGKGSTFYFTVPNLQGEDPS